MVIKTAYQAQVVTALKEPRTALRLAFVGANPAPTLVGADQLPERTSYLTGDDPAKWQADLASYAGVIYQQLYPGIDLQYDGNNGRLKSTYIVAVGAKPALLRWNYTGAQNVKIDKDGNLAIKLAPPRGRATEDRSVMEHAPVAWQDIAGQRIPVAAAYDIASDGSIGFALGQYDPAFALTIDPILTYSTYLGSGTGLDQPFDIKVFPEYEQQCHWPHTIGATDTRNYNWGPQLATPGTAWRNAFQTAIQSWNSAGTNFVLFENAALSNITMDLANVPNGDSGLTFISCSGSTIIHSYVTVNTAINLTPVTEVPAHEIGHGQGLGHIASDGAIMRYDTGGVTGPQAQDVELHRLLYP